MDSMTMKKHTQLSWSEYMFSNPNANPFKIMPM